LVHGFRPQGVVLPCLDSPLSQILPSVYFRGLSIPVHDLALLLREQGMCILNYLNVWLISAHLRDLLFMDRDLMIDQLGLRVNWDKSKVSPAQSISYLDMELTGLSL
ncbi:MAG: hypothetical protein ACRDC7_11370, partial [Aeromonas veronii]